MADPPPPGAIVFTTHPSGRVTVDGFPDAIAVADADLAAADPARFYLDRATRRLRIRAANGEAEYLAFLAADGRTWNCARLYARLDDGG